MDLPETLPSNFENLSSYQRAESDPELLAILLSQSLSGAVSFFEAACDNESWLQRHLLVAEGFLDQLTNDFSHNHLELNYAQRIAKTIKDHSELLAPHLRCDILVRFKSTTIPCNSLLLGAESSIFRQLIYQALSEKRNELQLPGLPPQQFVTVLEYLNTGRVEGLWRFEPDQLQALLKCAVKWELLGLAEQCQEVLVRYLTHDNVVRTLQEAHIQKWSHLKEAACTFLNKQGLGCAFSVTEKGIAVRLESFQGSTQDFLLALRFLITQLIFTPVSIEYAEIGQLLNQCKNLTSLDCSDTLEFHSSILKGPRGLKDLSLVQCPWLSVSVLQVLVETYPSLERLFLGGNIDLDYNFFSGLKSFVRLELLNLDYCYQLTDQDLLIIVRSLPQLQGLSLEGCKELSARGFFDIASFLSELTSLNLTRCMVTDGALMEIGRSCSFLKELVLSRCPHISLKGIIHFVQHASMLRRLDLSYSHLTEQEIVAVRQLRPSVEVVT